MGGKSWTIQDEELLQSLVSEYKFTPADMALKLGRTKDAINSRLALKDLKTKLRPVGLSGIELYKWLWDVRIKPFLTPNNGCLEWNKSSDAHGYGDIRTKNKLFRTHRISFMANHNVEITSDDLVLHKCDNPKCNNPDHLYRGTFKENSNDMMSRNRNGGQFKIGHRNSPEHIVRGEESVAAKLTNATVLEARARYKSGEMGYKRLAKIYGVGPSTMKNALSGKTWAHI